jgi:hypothetical protein
LRLPTNLLAQRGAADLPVILPFLCKNLAMIEVLELMPIYDNH